MPPSNCYTLCANQKNTVVKQLDRRVWLKPSSTYKLKPVIEVTIHNQIIRLQISNSSLNTVICSRTLYKTDSLELKPLIICHIQICIWCQLYIFQESLTFWYLETSQRQGSVTIIPAKAPLFSLFLFWTNLSLDWTKVKIPANFTHISENSGLIFHMKHGGEVKVQVFLNLS